MNATTHHTATLTLQEVSNDVSASLHRLAPLFNNLTVSALDALESTDASIVFIICGFILLPAVLVAGAVYSLFTGRRTACDRCLDFCDTQPSGTEPATGLQPDEEVGDPDVLGDDEMESRDPVELVDSDDETKMADGDGRGEGEGKDGGGDEGGGKTKKPTKRVVVTNKAFIRPAEGIQPRVIKGVCRSLRKK